MREVHVVGVGTTPFVRRSDRSSSDLGADAVTLALADGGVQWEQVALLVAGAVGAGMSPGSMLLRRFRRTGIPVLNVENASATGSTAFAEAYYAVASGRCDTAVAVGFGSLEHELVRAMMSSGAPDLAAVAGSSLAPVVFALVQSRRSNTYGERPDAAARVAVKNHANGSRNPIAQRGRVVSFAEVVASPIVSAPIHRLECCPLGDGGSAVVLSANSGGAPSVRVLASVSRSDEWHPAGAFLPDPEITRVAASAALRAAGIASEDLDVVEVHDAFAVEELEYIEALGLAEPGSAGELLERGAFDIGGRVAVSPSGGLLSRGHPGGATGLAQIVEIVQQLRGSAGNRQQPNAKTGLAQMIGAGGACVVHVLGR